MLVVGDTSVGNTNGGPVDVGVGLSCKPTSDPRVGGSGHRCQAAALPPSEEERSSRGAAGSRMIHGCSLAGEHNDGTRERGSMQRENSACLTIGTRRNVAGGKRKGEKGEGLAMFKSP